MVQNAFVLSVRYFVIDLVWGIIFFPFWWYTRGLARFGIWIWSFLTLERQSLSIGIWVKNLFVPMYGTHDIAGRLISIFMRLVQIIGRTFLLGIWSVLLFALFILYLCLPVLVVIQILYHVVGAWLF